jgi:chromosome segregation ATPase
METNWNHKRQAIERDSREALKEQGSIQVSLITHETDNARKELQAFKQEMSTARQTLQEIQSQNETLQRNTADQTKQMGQLQTIVAEIKSLKQEMRDEATKLDKAIHQTTQLQ